MITVDLHTNNDEILRLSVDQDSATIAVYEQGQSMASRTYVLDSESHTVLIDLGPLRAEIRAQQREVLVAAVRNAQLALDFAQAALAAFDLND